MPDHPLKVPAMRDRGVWGVGPTVDAFGVGTYCVDLDGRLTDLNPAGRALLRCDADELGARTSFRGRISTGCSGRPTAAGGRRPGVQH